MTQGYHRIHQLKRANSEKKEYPHPDPKIRLLDSICLGTAVVMPLTAIPQIIKLWTTRDASGLSILMWIFMFMLCIPLIIYGVVHKEKVITVMNIMWAAVDIVVIIGIIIFG